VLFVLKEISYHIEGMVGYRRQR